VLSPMDLDAENVVLDGALQPNTANQLTILPVVTRRAQQYLELSGPALVVQTTWSAPRRRWPRRSTRR
jgi:hypothetical protein